MSNDQSRVATPRTEATYLMMQMAQSDPIIRQTMIHLLNLSHSCQQAILTNLNPDPHDRDLKAALHLLSQEPLNTVVKRFLQVSS